MDHIKRGEIALIINTPLGRASHFDEQAIVVLRCIQRSLRHPMTGAQAIVEALLPKRSAAVRSILCRNCMR